MDFREYVRDRLPPLAIAREPEIVDELSQHLSDLYQEARAAGATHEVALARASAALPPSSAKPTSILALILSEGLRLVAIGAVIGLTAALVAARWVESQLFGVRATDPLTLAAVCLLLTTVAVVACLIPARRAMRVDPAVALRTT